ncbi:MFS transporter [Streptomyces mirabilis]|jgi:MFS family permease|uniref:MFS transporter n=1 Tax=Streptomyces mirabilis TaxID=68239 RepID=UPI00227D727A|nr:MFS transporter [Streptomyces mirabilis]
MRSLPLRRELRQLLAADTFVRLTGLAYYTVFTAGIYQLTGRVADVGLIGAATLLPALLMVVTAGRLTARLTARRTVIAFTGARVVLFAGAALLPITTASLLVVASLNSLIHQAVLSAKRTFDADVLQEQERTSYNAQRTMVGNVLVIVAPPLGGVAVTVLGLTWSLVIGAVLGAALLPLLVALKAVPTASHVEQEQEVSVGMSASLRHLFRMPQVVSMVTTYCLVVIILEVESPLMFPFAEQAYGLDGSFTGLLLGLGGLGGIVGAILTQRFPRVFSESSLSWMIVFDGLVFFAFTQAHSVPVACALFTLLGAMGSVSIVLVEGAVQEHVASAHRPFVFSVMQFAGGAGGAALGVVAAYIANSTGAKSVLAWCALIEVAAGLVCALVWQIVRKRRVHETQAEAVVPETSQS